MPRAGRIAAIALVLTLGGPLPLLWAAPAETAPAQASQRFPIRIGNRTIVTLRGSMLGYNAEERAAAAERRLKDLIERPGSSGFTAGTSETEAGVTVEVEGRAVFMITPGDVNSLLDETPASVAERAARAVALGLSEAREEREPRVLLLASTRAAVVTLIWLLILRGLFLANRELGRRISRAVLERADRLRVTQVTQVPMAQLYSFTRRLVSAGGWLLALGATSTWLTLTLESFAWTRPLGEQVEGSIVGVLAFGARAVIGAIPGLMVVAVIALVTRFLVGILRPIFDRIEHGGIETGILTRHTAPTTRRLVTTLLWLFALAMAYPYLPGSQTEAFKGLSVLAGLMVSLGASGMVGQAASGLIILYAHALRPGQYIRVGESEGTVVEIGMFSTRLRTGLGEDVLLPNSFILGNPLKSFSRPSGTAFVLDTGVTIGYDVPWRQVEAMLLDAARRVPAIATSPAPYVIQTALSDFYVAYRLVASSGESVPRQRMEVLNDLHAAIQDVFNENGVQIMSPHYVLDPRAPKVVPRERWNPSSTRGGEPQD
jgi:small-conductance mechanosensitive channel